MSLPASGHPAVIVPKALRTEIGRAQLLEQLAATETPVVALVAPSGYGKTTLLAQYARGSARRVVWLTLSESDSDVEFFLASLCRAFGDLFGPGRLNVEGGETPERFMQRFVALLAEAGESLDLILDRTELLEAQVGRLLTPLLQQLPEGHRVLLSGFNLDTLPLARLGAAGRVQLIEGRQLAFSHEECAAFMAARGHAGDAGEVFRSLEGWPAGTALAASGAHVSLEPRHLVLEALDALSGPVRDPLPEASVLPVWSEVGAGAAGLRLPPGWLDEVRRSGLPLTPLGRDLYRPHQLLLETLDGLLRRQGGRYAELHRRRAERCAEGGDPLAALRHATRAQDWTYAAQLARDVLPRLYAQSEFSLIRSLLGGIPNAAQPQWMREQHAVALIETGEVELGEAALHKLHQAGETTVPGYTALTLLAVRTGQFERQLELAEQGVARFDAHETFALRLQRASALVSLGRAAEGLAACQALVFEARRRGAHLQEAKALLMQQYARQALEQWPEREGCIRAAHAIFSETGQVVATIQSLDLLAEIDVMAGRWREAHLQLEQAVRLAEEQQPLMLPSLRITGALLCAAQAEPARAAEELEEALRAARRLHLNVLLPLIQFMRFDALLSCGRRQEAHDALQAGLTANTPLAQAHAPFYQGRWALESGDRVGAEAHFAQAVQQYPDRFRQVRAQAYLCELARQAGHLVEGRLARLAAQLDGLDARSVLALDREQLTPLALACRQEFPAHPLATLSAQAEPVTLKPILEIRALGDLEVLLDGRPVRMPLQKSSELLVWLAWHGEGSLPSLLGDLWDGSRDTRHHEYFRVAVRRLRARLSGEAGLPFDPVPYDGRRYQVSPSLDVQLDAKLLLDDLGRHELGALETALGRYGGAFLPGTDAEWADTVREQVRAELVNVTLALAGPLERTSPPRAAQLYRQALRADEHAEDLHAGLIRALARFDQRQALQAYRTYVRMMRVAFDAPPSLALVKDFQALGLPRPA